MSFSNTTRNGQLVVNSVSLMAAWVRVLNLPTLWMGGGARGDNPTVDGVAGEIAEPWILDAAEYDLEILVAGDVLYNGGTPSSPAVGVATNVGYLRSSLWVPHTSYAATVTLPDGSTTLTATVQVRGFEVGDTYKTAARCAVALRATSGRFA